MDDAFQLAGQLLAIGMVTIFTMLTLVVLTGQGLIRIVNRFFPLAEKPEPASAAVPEAHIVAIQAAVDHMTTGQGEVSRIQSDAPPTSWL